MCRVRRPSEQVFAVIRYDFDAPELELRVRVKEVVWNAEIAEAEVERLNH